MKKKRLTLILIIFAVMVLILTLSSTLFMLASVKVNFLCTNTLFINKEEAIINSGYFDYGKNVMLLNKQKYIKNLEKNNAYLKVINLEVQFPNIIVINCIQRDSLFCFKTESNTYYITDEEFKILELCEDKPVSKIFVDNLIISNNYKIGDFIIFDQTTINILNSIKVGMYEWNSNNDFLKLKIGQVILNYQSKDKVCFVMIDDKKLIIDKITNEYSTKFNMAFSTYVSYLMQDRTYVQVYEDSNNCIKCVIG